ncbi:MAG: hypothetical protein OXU26_09740 [Acidobacteriota bacterium]|nr:hypothetical protein [Acidobacteriota bacterium]MDE2964184.1 hypothetical protein [Acidobacteriota bacterium]
MLNFETFYLISIPGFVVGIMTGRFFAGDHWRSMRGRMGSAAKLLGGLVFLVYLFSIPLILAILLIYLVHLPEAEPAKIAVTLLAGLWMAANFVLEIANLVNRRSSRQSR